MTAEGQNCDINIPLQNLESSYQEFLQSLNNATLIKTYSVHLVMKSFK